MFSWGTFWRECRFFCMRENSRVKCSISLKPKAWLKLVHVTGEWPQTHQQIYDRLAENDKNGGCQSTFKVQIWTWLKRLGGTLRELWAEMLTCHFCASPSQVSSLFWCNELFCFSVFFCMSSCLFRKLHCCILNSKHVQSYHHSWHLII